MKIFKLLALSMVLLFAVSCGSDEPTEVTDKCKDVSCDNGQVCLPSSGKCVDQGDNDKCKGVSCDPGEACNPDNGQCESSDSIDSISKLRKIGSVMSKTEIVTGSTLTTKLDGIVIAVKGINTSKKHGAYVCEPGATEYACLYVDFYSIKSDTFVSPKIGDTVKVKGIHKEYYGETQLAPQTAEDFEITGTADVPAATEVVANGFEEKYEGMLVKLKDAPFKVVLESDVEADPKRYDTEMEDSNGVAFKMSSSLHYPYYELPTGTSLTSISGIIIYSYGEYKLYPRIAEDLVK